MILILFSLCFMSSLRGKFVVIRLREINVKQCHSLTSSFPNGCQTCLEKSFPRVKGETFLPTWIILLKLWSDNSYFISKTNKKLCKQTVMLKHKCWSCHVWNIIWHWLALISHNRSHVCKNCSQHTIVSDQTYTSYLIFLLNNALEIS